jgi:hypothetical protein
MELSQSRRSIFQNLAWVYAAMFFFTVALGYIPAFTDNAGLLFGLFSIQLRDDILHLASGVWAAWAGWRSTRASIFYFKTFGIIYALDGLLGLITGYGYLDGGIFFAHFPVFPAFDFTTRLFANLPHIVIGGTAVFIGFVLSRKFAADA